MSKTNLCILLRIGYLIVTISMGIVGVLLYATHDLSSLTFYTLQSNIASILISVFYIQQLFSRKKMEDKILAIINGGIVMCIMLTFLVFHFVLLPTIDFTSDTLGPGNIYVHYVLPLMILGDYLLFQKKGRFNFRSISFWCLAPLCYAIFVFVYSALGGRFGETGLIVPYFFLDYTQFGIDGVALFILIFAVGYVALCSLFVLLDKGLGKIHRKAKA